MLGYLGAARPTAAEASWTRPCGTCCRPPSWTPPHPRRSSCSATSTGCAPLRYDRAAARYQAYLAIDDQAPRVLYKLGFVRYNGRPARGGDRRAAQGARARRAVRRSGIRPRPLPARRAAPGRRRAVRSSRRSRIQPALLPAREELAELYGALGRTDER